MKIIKHLKGVKAKHSLPKLSLSAKVAFASLLLLNMDASAGTFANNTFTKARAVKATALNFKTLFADIRVTGKVIDEKGEPLIGVSVKLRAALQGLQQT